MSLLQKRSDLHFSYPSNLYMLDLATLVSLYRNRGEPRKAPPGEFFACAITKKLIKEAKYWFGLHYSQNAWDILLTKNSEGYPITEVEMNILGMIKTPPSVEMDREFIEKNCGVPQHFAYMILNDLRTFGFIEEESGYLICTAEGSKALDGFTRRVFEKNYIPEMLLIANRPEFGEWYKSEPSHAGDGDQATLF